MPIPLPYWNCSENSSVSVAVGFPKEFFFRLEILTLFLIFEEILKTGS